MAKRESTGVDPFARLANKAKTLDKLFKTTNPNKETELAEGVYYALVTKIRGRSIGKANEEQHPAIGVETIALCDKDGGRDDIWGKGASGIFVIKETEKQTLGDAFSRFIYFLQDSLLLQTSQMSVQTLKSDLDDIQSEVNKEIHLVSITVSIGTNGRKNVNFGSAISPEQLQEVSGVKLKEVKAEFRDESSTKTKGKKVEDEEEEDEDVEEEDDDLEEEEDEEEDEEEEDEEEEDEEEDEDDVEDEEEEEEEEEEEYTPPPKKPAAGKKPVADKKPVAKKAAAKKKK